MKTKVHTSIFLTALNLPSHIRLTNFAQKRPICPLRPRTTDRNGPYVVPHGKSRCRHPYPVMADSDDRSEVTLTRGFWPVGRAIREEAAGAAGRSRV